MPSSSSTFRKINVSEITLFPPNLRTSVVIMGLPPDFARKAEDATSRQLGVEYWQT